MEIIMTVIGLMEKNKVKEFGIMRMEIIIKEKYMMI